MIQTTTHGEDIDITEVKNTFKIFKEKIDIKNVHLFAQYLYEQEPKLAGALVLELEANYMFNNQEGVVNGEIY